jgi:uncharacterized protein
MMHSSKQLLGFFALTFAWSWTCWLLAPIVKADSNFASNALFFLGGFGPTVAAVTVVGMTSGYGGLRAWLGKCLQWRNRWGWMTLAFLVPLAVLTLAAAMHMVLGGSVAAPPNAGRVALLLANFGLVFLVGGPLGEELGWRGYAQPAMQERMGWRTCSLVLGAVWGVWHLPLFFLAGSSQNQGSILAFFVLIVATSVFYTWLFNRSVGSVVPALLLHTASNSWPSVVPILPSDAEQRPYLFVVALVVTAAIWLLARRDDISPQKGRPS